MLGNTEIVKAGPLSTVQDLGRLEHEASGVRVCGVMDRLAASIANRLVNNPTDAALIEQTLMGDQIRFSQPTRVAVCGADAEVRLDGERRTTWQSFAVEAGSVLSVKGMAWGVRSYVAVQGGWQVEPVMGSASTDLIAGLGGVNGRSLRATDSLRFHFTESLSSTSDLRFSSARLTELYQRDRAAVGLRIVLGPDLDHFAARFLSRLGYIEFKVGSDSNRQGITLEIGSNEQELHSALGPDIVSSFTTMGSIQVPAHGRPTILMADRQSTGGFARLGKVIDADLPALAQCRVGQTIVLLPVSIEEARAASRYLDSVCHYARLES